MASLIRTEQQLRDACTAGGTWELDEEVIEVASTIHIRKPIILQGLGGTRSVITIPDRCTWGKDVPVFFSNGVPNIKFLDLGYDGNAGAQGGLPRGNGYHTFAEIQSCTNLEIARVTMHDGLGDGFRVRKSKNVLYHHNNAWDLGHDVLYCLGCNGVTMYKNDHLTQTNSGGRFSYGAANVKIYDNYIHSKHEGKRTGPGFEFDKGGSFTNIEVWNNILENIYGSAIWAFGEGTTCSNFVIHHNRIRNCGKYPSAIYSQAALNTGALDGVVFRNNIVEDVLNAVRYYNYKGVSGSFEVHSENNEISNATVGYDVMSAGGKITVTNDKLTHVRTIRDGNVVISGSTPAGSVGPSGSDIVAEPQATVPDDSIPEQPPVIPSATEENGTEQIKATIRVKLPSGFTVDETFDLDSTKATNPPETDTLVTCRFFLPDNSMADRTFSMAVTPAPGTVTNPEGSVAVQGTVLAQIKLRRANRDYGEATILIPIKQGTGGKADAIVTVFKVKTPDGRYAQRTFDMKLSDPTQATPEEPQPKPQPEPEPTPEPESTFEPAPEIDPATNATPSASMGESVKVTFRLWRADGKAGATTFSLQMGKEKSSTAGTKITCRLATPDGLHAEQTFALNVAFTADSYMPTVVIPTAIKDATGEVIKVQVKLRRAAGTYGQATFELPTTAVTAYAQKKTTSVTIKARTAELYGEKKFELRVK